MILEPCCNISRKIITAKGAWPQWNPRLRNWPSWNSRKVQRANEEQLSRQKAANLRLTALNSYRVGSYQKSIAEWQEYLKFEPNSDEAYFYLGANYQDQKQLDTAILNFEKCISLNPGNILAHLNLGLLYDYHRNNFKQAEEHLRKAKELGGAEKYSPDRLQSMIQDLQDRAQAFSVLKMLFPGRAQTRVFQLPRQSAVFRRRNGIQDDGNRSQFLRSIQRIARLCHAGEQAVHHNPQQ